MAALRPTKTVLRDGDADADSRFGNTRKRAHPDAQSPRSSQIRQKGDNGRPRMIDRHDGSWDQHRPRGRGPMPQRERPTPSSAARLDRRGVHGIDGGRYPRPQQGRNGALPPDRPRDSRSGPRPLDRGNNRGSPRMQQQQRRSDGPFYPERPRPRSRLDPQQRKSVPGKSKQLNDGPRNVNPRNSKPPPLDRFRPRNDDSRRDSFPPRDLQCKSVPFSPERSRPARLDGPRDSVLPRGESTRSLPPGRFRPRNDDSRRDSSPPRRDRDDRLDPQRKSVPFSSERSRPVDDSPRGEPPRSLPPDRFRPAPSRRDSFPDRPRGRQDFGRFIPNQQQRRSDADMRRNSHRSRSSCSSSSSKSDGTWRPAGKTPGSQREQVVAADSIRMIAGKKWSPPTKVTAPRPTPVVKVNTAQARGQKKQDRPLGRENTATKGETRDIVALTSEVKDSQKANNTKGESENTKDIPVLATVKDDWHKAKGENAEKDTKQQTGSISATTTPATVSVADSTKTSMSESVDSAVAGSTPSHWVRRSSRPRSVPVVLKVPATLGNSLKDIVKDTITPELTEASTETNNELRASASYSSCSVTQPTTVIGESPHSLTHPEDEGVVVALSQQETTRQQECDEKGSGDAATAVADNVEHTATAEVPPRKSASLGAASSDSDSSDSSDDETDEEELTRWAQKMFGIIPTSQQQQVPQEESDDDSSESEDEMPQQEQVSTPRLQIKLPKRSTKRKASPSSPGKQKCAKTSQNADTLLSEASDDAEEPLTPEEVRKILGNDWQCDAAAGSSHWVRRSMRHHTGDEAHDIEAGHAIHRERSPRNKQGSPRRAKGGLKLNLNVSSHSKVEPARPKKSRRAKTDEELMIEAEEAKRKKHLAKPLTAADVRKILAQDQGCAESATSSHWVRRSMRQPSKSALNSPNVRSLLDKLRVNDYDMTVLKMKKYLSDPDTPPMILDAALDALEENTNCQALYIQNFNEGMRDEQVLHLLKILQMPSCNIWCLNIGETYNVTGRTWKRFAKGLKKTKVTHMYASEHTITSELKEQIRATIRKNRTKHNMHIDPDNLDVIVQCTHCWWNPINAKVLRPFLSSRGYEYILHDKEAQGLRGSLSEAPSGDPRK